jgi:hypothetical protein
MNPFFKINEIKGVWIFDSFFLKPFYEKWKIVDNLFSVKYPVYHMATKQPHFNLITNMRIYALIFVNVFEYV